MAVFEVLAESHRRRILDLLLAGEQPVGALVEQLGLSQPAVSKHLRILRHAGLVGSRVDAQRRLYQLEGDGLRELDDWLAPYRRMWNRHLDQLDHHLTSMSEAQGDK